MRQSSTGQFGDHLTSEQISAVVSGDGPSDADRHLRECAACGAEVGTLRETLALFGESGRRWSEHHMAKPLPGRRRKALVPAAALLAASILAGALWIQRPVPAVKREPPFIEIPYVAPLAPYERASVMRLDVPVAALIAAGFEVRGPEPGGTVTADVLVGQDGRPHAIRLISNRSAIQ